MHPLHTGRYSGAATIPAVGGAMKPAAALVVHHEGMSRIDPMFRQLDSAPGVRELRLVPITVMDFYPKERS